MNLEQTLNGAKEPMLISFCIIIGIMLVFVIFPLLLSSSRIAKDIFGENETGEPQTSRAKVLSKDVSSPMGSIDSYNFVVFEKENGERLELAIKDDEDFKMIFEGDDGILTHTGKRFISFVR